MKQIKMPGLLSTNEFAAALGVHPSRVRQWVMHKQLVPAGMIGNTQMFREQDVEPLRSRKTEPGPAKRSDSGKPASKPIRRPRKR